MRTAIVTANVSPILPVRAKSSSPGLLPPGQHLLRELFAASLILTEDWDNLTAEVRGDLERLTDRDELVAHLVEARLLTEYQASRVLANKTHGLLLGNYRVLDRLGAGGMGIVFKGEHILMRRPVAIKVLPQGPAQDRRVLLRFLSEIRAVARLQHPNIIAAMDAGEVPSLDADDATLHYFVMEYILGQDLEDYVIRQGPLPVARACDLIHQVASALAEAHKHHLVHRDIKPSNILVTAEEQAKLLDFGLARRFGHRLTEPGCVLGTIDYMAPEQARDASAVDIRADIYGLGGTLFWCLAGRLPFLPLGTPDRDLLRRLTQAPPSVRAFRSDIPVELDRVITRMMAINPEERYATPQAVMGALLGFLKTDSRMELLSPSHPPGAAAAVQSAPERKAHGHQILVVDDEADIRMVCRVALQSEGMRCDEAPGGRAAALEALHSRPYDLLLLDVDMPGLSGVEVLRQLREQPPVPHLKVIMFSGRCTADEMAQMMLSGADDYIAKPFSIVQLLARIQAALNLKDAQERTDLLNRHLLAVNAELERNLGSRDIDLVHARNALVLSLAKLVEQRQTETGTHLLRMQRYCRCLAEEATQLPSFAGQIDPHFIQMLECCAPLHDIGKVALPDHILLKPGKLDPDERILMQTHTLIGAETLMAVAREHGSAMAFLQMAIDIARHHHEHWNGAGYPDRLAGTAIPLAARLVAVADVYDALRSRRTYKPALSHSGAMHVIMELSEGQFDPHLLQALSRCAAQFEQIFRELAN